LVEAAPAEVDNTGFRFPKEKDEKIELSEVNLLNKFEEDLPASPFNKELAYSDVNLAPPNSEFSLPKPETPRLRNLDTVSCLGVKSDVGGN